jgi:regulator of cell morphogenesis and NO signaling
MYNTPLFRTVGDLAAAWPTAVQALQRHGIDYCCSQQSLEAACIESGLSVEELLVEIRRADDDPLDATALAKRPTDELLDVIVERYHKPLDQELPRLEALARRVLAQHEPRHGEQLGSILHLFKGLRESIERHMEREEQAVFPWIRAGRSGSDQPMLAMQKEHHAEEWLLGKLREEASGYLLPKDASASWGELWEGLQRLESSLVEHHRVEDEVLLPRLLGSASKAHA